VPGGPFPPFKAGEPCQNGSKEEIFSNGNAKKSPITIRVKGCEGPSLRSLTKVGPPFQALIHLRQLRMEALVKMPKWFYLITNFPFKQANPTFNPPFAVE